LDSIHEFVHFYPEEKSQFESYLQKQIWTKSDREQICIIFARLLIEFSGDQKITILGNILKPILLDITCYIFSEESVVKNIQSKVKILSIVQVLVKVLDLSPQVLPLFVVYFRNAPSLFHILESEQDKKELNKYKRGILEAAYKLLRYSVSDFRSLWNWSILFPLLKDNDPVVFSFAYGCISLLFGLSELIMIENNLLVEKKIDYKKIILEYDDKHNTELNKAIEMHLNYQTQIRSNVQKYRISGTELTSKDVHSCLVDVCGLLIPVLNQNNQKIDTFVDTKITHRNMRALALAVCKGKPILLEGVTGSGKTALIEELAMLTGNNTLLKIHLGDQSDAKVLLGTYVCTDIPGEFKWVNGILTRAVASGLWMVIEDINLAPIEVLSVLLPLLEKRELFIPGRGELITAHPSFQLFATQTTFTGYSRSNDSTLLSNFWTRVIIEPLTSSELTTVLSGKYNSLEPIVPMLVQTFDNLMQTKTSTMQSVQQQSNDVLANIPVVHSRRAISVRDVMKWCNRANILFSQFKLKSNFISAQIRESIFLEAIDCFCGSLPKYQLRQQVALQIAPSIGVPSERVTYLMDTLKPDIVKTDTVLAVGRVELPVFQKPGIDLEQKNQKLFAYSRQSILLMEKIAQCIKNKEPVLLVGETGCGKTTTVQHLATQLNQKLIVLNLNQQSDSADLLGGFKPIEVNALLSPLKKKFDKLFARTYTRKGNTKFLSKLEQIYLARNWTKLITLFKKITDKAFNAKSIKGTGTKRKKDTVSSIRDEWSKFKAEVMKFEIQQDQIKNNFAFAFIEGALVKAIQKGHWVLLDEINLASAETLESLSGLLEGGSLTLTERGDILPITRHPNFCIFACMNPPNDIGKRELPPGLRNRFTEFFVDELENPDDLNIFVTTYLKTIPQKPPINDIVTFYLEARQLSNQTLSDGAHQRPRYSLRTLARTLEYSKNTLALFGFPRALSEGALMSFLTQLDTASIPIMEKLIAKHLHKNVSEKILKQLPKSPGPNYIQFETLWLKKGTGSNY